MDPIKVARYFAALEDEMSAKELTLSPARIWKIDETGLTMDHRPRKVVATTGAKHLQSSTSSNREMVQSMRMVNASHLMSLLKAKQSKH